VTSDAHERPVHRVGRLADFPPGTHRVVEVGKRSIGVFNIKGVLHAIPNLCPHQTGPLCESPATTGTLSATKESDWRPEWVHDGEIVICPWHGMEYHVPTGQCLAWPNIRLRTYELVVEHDVVSIRL
jgi:nitrite reductase/ring-hydroxylating ferredoxin subunit